MQISEAMWYLIVFGGVALFTLVLTLVTVKARRRMDQDSLALRAAQVTAECEDLLLGPGFLWSVWHDTARMNAMTMLIRDERDRVITTVTHSNVPIDGILRRFELDGRQYEIRKVSVRSSRTVLCETGQDRVLLSADHQTLRTTYCRGNGETPLFVVRAATVFHRFRSVRIDDSEIGKVIMGLKALYSVGIITLPAGDYSPLEQVFVLASL